MPQLALQSLGQAQEFQDSASFVFHPVTCSGPAGAGSRDAGRLILDDDRGADGYAAVEIGHVLIGHTEASGGNRLSDRLGLVGTVDAIERRSQIHRPRAEWV